MTWSIYLPLIDGAAVTAALSAISILSSFPLGLLLAVVRWRNVPFLSGILATFVTLIRAIPFVTLVLFIFFLLPAVGLELSAVSASVLALTMNTTAFSSEIWRAAFESFSRDQMDAAAAFGMSGFQMFRRIIFPQAWRANIGPLVNEATILLKGTPAVAVIGVVEITRAASRIGAQTYEPLPPFLVATVLYTLLVASIVRSQRLIERKIVRRYGGALS
jgi:His/Glu/Gln/Arg/opine family amino acid ABC transporter permease subunit